MSTKEQIQNFVEACEELQRSKIILADAKVSNVIRSIVTSPVLVGIVGETLVGYNFANELENIGKKQKGIVLPSEPYRVIAFCFSLLSEVDAGRMDLQEFVDEYFEAESLAESFARFNAEVMTPFRQFLCAWAGEGASPKSQKSAPQAKVEEVGDEAETIEECDCPTCESEPIDPVDEFFADVEVILTQIKETICLDSKIKAEKLANLNITLNAMLEVTAMQNFRIFNALLISLNNLLGSVKSVRFYNMELKNRVADFYLNKA